MALAVDEPVKVREPDPTRFFVRMSQAVDMVEAVLDLEREGIFVPRNLKAFSVRDVAEALDVDVIPRPLLSYEKQHESLVAYGSGEIAAGFVGRELAQVRPGWQGGDPPGPYNSETAPRMTGVEFLEEVRWKT
jgi:hypothetical protein